jgi:hypothetical protein
LMMAVAAWSVNAFIIMTSGLQECDVRLWSGTLCTSTMMLEDALVARCRC